VRSGLVVGNAADRIDLGPGIAAAGLALGVPSTIWWRVLLALGAVPAASVVLMRRRLKESPPALSRSLQQARRTSPMACANLGVC